VSDFVSIPSTHEVWAVIHASHKGRVQVFSSFSNPDGCFQGGDGTHGVMETAYCLGGTDYPIMRARSEWDITADGKRFNESHKYWLCVAVKQSESA
jgi:hypothetical protein